MAPTKKLIICCDGTGNDSDGTTNVPTNVAKIARCLTHRGPSLTTADSIPQFVYYQSGIATKSSGSLGARFDGLTGRGITENIRSAYSFICNNYEPDDEIYLIGFSRGAYTVRCISTLINDIGLLTKHSLGYFYDVFTAWQAKNILAKDDARRDEPNKYTQIRDMLLSDASFAYKPGSVRITACAVFDTVGSLGIAATESDSTFDYITDILRGAGIHWLPRTAKGTQAFEFVDTVVSPNIDHAIQALALDEHRGHFPPTIWEDPDKTAKSLKQCWFSGCHSHVGGGVEDNGDLPNVSLAWMLAQLKPLLSFDAGLINCTSDDNGLLSILQKVDLKGEKVAKGHYLTDSRTGLYKLDGDVVRKPGMYRTWRKDEKNEYIDEPLKNTNEMVHKSVRVRYWGNKYMLENKQAYEPLALKGRWAPGTDAPWPWKYGKKTEKVPDLPEADFGDDERAILVEWSNDHEKKHLEDIILEGSTQ